MTSTKQRSSTVDRILTLIDDCLAEVDAAGPANAGTAGVRSPAWTARVVDGATTAA